MKYVLRASPVHHTGDIDPVRCASAFPDSGQLMKLAALGPELPCAMETIRSLLATSARSPGSLAPSGGDGSLLAIDALRPTESADRHVFDVGRREADCRERIAHVPSESEMVFVRPKDVDHNESAALASSRDRVKRARREVTELLSPRSKALSYRSSAVSGSASQWRIAITGLLICSASFYYGYLS